MGSSIKGVGIGCVLVLVAVGLLWWNEGDSVKTAKALESGAGSCVSVPSNAVDAANEGKLIHTSGKITTDAVLNDPIFGVSRPGLTLSRSVQMFQWEEVKHEETKKEKQLGGGVKTTVVKKPSTFSQKWSSMVIDSSVFDESSNINNTIVNNNVIYHVNPSAMPYEKAEVVAPSAKLGAFDITDGMIRSLGKSEVVKLGADEYPASAVDTAVAPVAPVAPVASVAAAVPAVDAASVSAVVVASDAAPVAAAPVAAPAAASSAAPLAGKIFDGRLIHITPEGYYLGNNPTMPQIGDVKVSFKVSVPGDASVIAMQKGSSFAPMTVEGKQIFEQAPSIKTMQEMFADAQTRNTAMTWVIRVLGFIIMCIAFGQILLPLSVLADVVPFFGDIAEVGTGFISKLMALALSFFVIAIAWVFYRPLIGILLLVVVIGSVVAIAKAVSGTKRHQAAPAAAAPAEEAQN